MTRRKKGPRNKVGPTLSRAEAREQRVSEIYRLVPLDWLEDLGEACRYVAMCTPADAQTVLENIRRTAAAQLARLYAETDGHNPVWDDVREAVDRHIWSACFCDEAERHRGKPFFNFPAIGVRADIVVTQAIEDRLKERPDLANTGASSVKVV